jgi:hypothetical protein
MPPTSRKRRPANRMASPLRPADTSAPRTAARPSPAATASAARRSRREQHDAAARAALEPLAPGERPPALIVASAVAVILAAGVMVGAATIHDLARRGGSIAGAAFLASVLAALGLGMWRRRYWAVLSFEALLAFQALVTALALLVAETARAAIICVVSISLTGWLFWKLIRVMGRLQATRLSEHRSAR